MSEGPISSVQYKDAPEIAWEPGFYELDGRAQVRYLKKLASALNHALDLMQRERNELLEEREKLRADMANADEAVAIQKQATVHNILQANEKVSKLEKQVMELQAENKAHRRTIEDLRR